MATISIYPDETNGGPRIAKLIPYPVEYETTISRNEDGGANVNVQPCGRRKYQLEYQGLTATDVATLRAHVNLAKREVNNFSFYNRQTAQTLSGVKYKSWRVGKHVKTNFRFVSVELEAFE